MIRRVFVESFLTSAFAIRCKLPFAMELKPMNYLTKIIIALIGAQCFVHAQKVPDPPKLPAALVKDHEAISPEIMRATHDLRDRLLADPYRPAFHFAIPEGIGIPGDPNGAYYKDGVYHLMFLYNQSGDRPGANADGASFAWGHVSSTDLLHWRYHHDALEPGDGDDGVFSGGAFVDDDGTVVLSYWMLWGAKGIGLAMSQDGETWKKSPANPVIKSTEWGITEMKDASGKAIHLGSADPSNIWKKDGKYYMLTGNLMVLNKYGRNADSSVDERGDRLYLFESDDLKAWQYKHRFYESKREWTEASEDNMCPSFLPLPVSADGGKPSGKYLLLAISHNRGARYYIGDYRNDQFYPDLHARMSWKDNAFFAPEALMDQSGRQIMWSWIFDGRPEQAQKDSGWTGMYSLPRTLWLAQDGSLGIRPAKELESLRLSSQEKNNIDLKAGEDLALPGLGSELMELEVTLFPDGATQAGVKVDASSDGQEQTSIYYDARDRKLKLDTTKSSLEWGTKIVEEAPFELKASEPLVLHIYVDKGIVEVFANDRQAIARAVYPKLKGTGVRIFANGGDVKLASVKAWRLAPANPY